MKRHTFPAALLLIALLCIGAEAGSLQPSAPPTGGTMKPLDEVEPRIAVSQADIPLTITAPGSYYLTEAVTVTGIAVTVNADDVTIDLSGFAITGNPGSSYGVLINGRSNVEIRNGTIRSFIRAVTDTAYDGGNIRIIGINAVGLSGAGFYCFPENVLVKDCTLSDIGNQTAGQVYGVYAGHNAIVVNNRLYNIGNSEASNYVYAVRAGNGSRVSGNTISDSGQTPTYYAYGIYTLSGCQITDNSIFKLGESAGSAYSINVSEGCTVHHNTVSLTGLNAGSMAAINCGTGCTITQNTVYNNGTNAGNIYAIVGQVGCNFISNTVNSNGTNAGFTYALRVPFGSRVVGNTVYGNGKSATSSYGIYLEGESFVDQNAAYNNAGYNMNHPATCTFGTNHAP